MKHTFTNLLTRLCANTPPCFGKRSSQSALRSKSAQFLFSFLLVLVMSIGTAWGATFTPADIVKSGGTTTDHIKVSTVFSTESGKQFCSEETSLTGVKVNNSANGTYSSNYVEIAAQDGYTLTTCTLKVASSGTSAGTEAVAFWDGNASATTSSVATFTVPANNNSSCANTIISVPSGTKTIRLYRKICISNSDGKTFASGSKTDYGGSQTYYVFGITATAASSGGGEEKDYTVTAATSTGDNTLGTVSAGASSLDASETTKITATPATGYRVTNWEVSGTDASISPNGASNSNTTTLTMGTADATVTVTFGPKPYTIILDNQSATTAGTESVAATYNANTNLTSAITCPTKTDKVFAGYFTAANGGGVQLIDPAGNWIASAGGGSTYLDGSKNWKNDGNLTLYACWMEYANTFDLKAWVQSNLSSGSTTKTFTSLTTNKLLYTLSGNTELDNSSDASEAYDGLKFKNSGDYILFLVKANCSLKLYFGYTDTKPKISINGGAEADINVANTKSKTPNQDVDFGTQTYDRLIKVRTVTSNAVVLQKIEITDPASGFTVTYNGSGTKGEGTGSGTVPTDGTSYSSGATVTVLDITDLEFEVYDCEATFMGWNTDADMHSGTHYNPGATFNISANTTLYAVWGYDISYYEQDGTTPVDGMAPTSYIYTVGATLPTPSKTGYTGEWYNAWCVEAGCSSAPCGYVDKCKRTEVSNSDYCDAAYYVMWTAKEYTVTLNDNGGNSDGSGSVTLTYNSANHAAITNPTKGGFTFDGWYSEEGGTGTLIIDATGALQANTAYTGAAGIWKNDAAVTLYAKWTEIPSSDCSAYEFHYGTNLEEDWEIECFTQVGETNEWRIADFTIPSTPNYYVGHHSDGGWNDGWSANKAWTDSYSDGNGAMVLLPGTSAVGQATNATGTLIIWSNSGDKNKYVGFKPNGYGISYGGSSHAFAATETANMLETEVVTLPDVSTTYTMGLATATEGTYVTCAHSSAAEAISNMGVTNVGNGKKKIYLVPGSFDQNDAEEKYAIYDKTADAFDSDFMTDEDGDGVYEGYVSSTCASIILVRMSSEATTEELANKDWTHKWNQTTGDGIAISGTLAKKYTITSLNGNNCAYTETSVQPATGQKGIFRMWDNSSAQNWYVHFVPYYTLSYNANGGSGSTAATERNSESSTLTVTVASNAFTAPTGHHFDHWNTANDNNGDSYAVAANFTLTSDATLYAIWAANTHTLTWDFGEGGSTSSESYTAAGTVAYGTTITYPANNTMSRDGYTFTGWSTDAATMPDDNLTITAVWEEIIVCPESGTVFGWTKKTGLSNSEFSQGEYTYTPANPGDYLASITGGTVELHVNANEKIRIRNSELNFNGGDSYIHVTSACAFQEGDIINVSSSANIDDLKLTLTSTKPNGSGSKVVGTITQGTPFIIEVNEDNEDLDLVGETEFYIWRANSGTNAGTFTITRPEKFDVTYSSEKGSAPAGGTVSSVTLAEITGVSGWKNTGWKANVATEVSGEAVDANTLIANGSVVTLSAATTFTAQWAEFYTITTGSPANGTVAADKASALAGATITLTATPASGYKLKAWDVYKTGDATTKVSVTNNQFTMPAYGVTINAEFIESVVLYDYSVMNNKSFTDETVNSNMSYEKDITFGTEGNPQLIIGDAGWDNKGNIINSFIKYFGGHSSMSVVIPAGRKATVTIKYGSYDASGKYLLVNGTAQAKPIANMVDGMTTETFSDYMRTVELTNQTGTLVLTASTGNIYIAYVDVTLTGNASYGVTYHLNEGSWDGDAGAATYTYGTGIVTLATNVAQDYHDFAGWFGNEGLTGDPITSIANNATGDKELWAKWTPKSYTLTWSWDGGSCSATAGEDYTAGGSVAYGATLVYPEASTMSKDAAVFAGWSSTPATMPAEALTITAQWSTEHAITYTETKGATNSNPETYIEGIGVASFEPLADVTDFHFTGWSPASISAEATTNQTIEAQWVAAYNVSFSAGEGSGTVPATFQKWSGATVELPGQGSMVAPEGKVFAGWKVNGAGETRAAGYEYTMTAAAVEFVAQWKAVTLLINYDGENYSLNTTDFQTDIDLVDGVDGTGYDKQAKVKANITGFSNYDNLGKGVIYHSKTDATTVTLYMYNNYTGNATSTFYYTVVAEGETSSPSVTSETLNKNTGDSYEISMTGRSTLYVFCGQKELRISQIEVEEKGMANKVAPDVNYSVNLNKQRFILPSGVATTFEGMEYSTSSTYKPVNAIVQIKNLGTDYISFEIPEGQTRQLQLSTNNKVSYMVSKTKGDDSNPYTPATTTETKNWNLTAGTWYINPQGTSVQIANIAFAAAPASYTVTFDADGGSSVDAQVIFEDGKAVEPTAPTKSGYDFAGWYNGDDEYDFDAAVTEDVNLTAHWTVHVYNDATLKSLKYGEQSIALEDGVYEYNVELPYYTEGVPALTAVTNSKDAKTPVITNAAALDENNQATSTVSVTSEDATVTLLYQVHFTKVVLYEWQEISGSYNWDFTLAATAQIQLDGSSTIKKDEEAVMANIPGTTNNATFNSQALKFKGEYIYRGDDGTNYPSCASTIKFKTTVPGVVTVRYADNGGNNRCLSINGHYGPTSSSKTDYKTYSVCVPAGEVVLTGYKEGSGDKYMRFFEIDFTAASELDPTKAEESTLGGYERTVNPQYYGTVCLPKAGVMTGAMLFQVAYMDYKEDGSTPYKVYYDQVENGVMQAGMPYIFLAEESTIGVYYTGTAEETAKDHNGLHGTLVNITEGMNATGIYMLYNNQVVHSTNSASTLPANRAYLQISEIPGYGNPSYVAPAPKYRRISTGFNGVNSATGMDEIEASETPMKVMIEGQIYIIRGEKMYDVTGKLVK